MISEWVSQFPYGILGISVVGLAIIGVALGLEFRRWWTLKNSESRTQKQIKKHLKHSNSSKASS